MRLADLTKRPLTTPRRSVLVDASVFLGAVLGPRQSNPFGRLSDECEGFLRICAQNWIAAFATQSTLERVWQALESQATEDLEMKAEIDGKMEALASAPIYILQMRPSDFAAASSIRRKAEWTVGVEESLAIAMLGAAVPDGDLHIATANARYDLIPSVVENRTIHLAKAVFEKPKTKAETKKALSFEEAKAKIAAKDWRNQFKLT